MYKLWERLKAWAIEIVKSRAFVVMIAFCVMSAILVQRVFYLQIVKDRSIWMTINYRFRRQKKYKEQEAGFWTVTVWFLPTISLPILSQ